MARSHRAALLQLSHYGGPRNHLHRDSGDRRVVVISRRDLPLKSHALDSHARRASAVHRQYRGMDHGGSGAPAVVDLRVDAYERGFFATRLGRERVVHADWFHGTVHDSGDTVSVSGGPRDSSWPRIAWSRFGSVAANPGGCVEKDALTKERHGNGLVLSGCDADRRL